MSKHNPSSAALYQLFKSPQLNTAINLLGHTESYTLSVPQLKVSSRVLDIPQLKVSPHISGGRQLISFGSVGECLLGGSLLAGRHVKV